MTKRTSIIIDEELLQRLQRLAKRRKTTSSKFIRDAVAQYVTEAEAEDRPRRFSFIGIAESGYTDTAERAEEILDEELSTDKGWG